MNILSLAYKVLNETKPTKLKKLFKEEKANIELLKEYQKSESDKREKLETVLILEIAKIIINKTRSNK